MKIVIYLTLALVALISAFFIIFVSIPIGAGLSALGQPKFSLLLNMQQQL